jgi:drug/metabolite transporter (DMT)-like permease
VAIGYLTRGDMPATEAWIGAVLIIATGVCVAHRESLRRPRS